MRYSKNKTNQKNMITIVSDENGEFNEYKEPRMHKHRFGLDLIESDLNDPTTYDYLPKNLEELRRLMWYEIGFALWYMDYHMPDVYVIGDLQRVDIELLIRKFTDERRKNCQNVKWWQEQIFVFQCKIENMC